MDLRSIMTLPVHIALIPARIAVHVLFAVGNRWMPTPTPPPIDLPADTVNAREQCQLCAWDV